MVTCVSGLCYLGLGVVFDIWGALSLLLHTCEVIADSMLKG